MAKKEPVITDLDYDAHTLEKNRRYGQVTQSGVVYDEELSGPGGMSFVLLREAATTDEMLHKAIQELRSNRDVVGNIKVTRDIIASPQVQRPRGG